MRISDWSSDVCSSDLLFWWWFSFDAYAPKIFDTAGLIAVSGGFAAIVVAIGMSVCRGRERSNATTYGSARWATRREITRAGLLADNGLELGLVAHPSHRHHGTEHWLLLATTRSS